MQEFSTDDDARWLLPSDALTRFAPDEDPAQAEAVPTEEPGAQLRYGFQVGRYGVLTELGLTGEVVIEPVMYRVPLAPTWLIGVINQRGNIVPVFDLASLLAGPDETVRSGAASSAPDTPKIVVVLGKGEAAAGLWADDLPRPLAPGGEPPTEEVMAQMPPTVTDYLRPSFSADGVLWLELDYAGLFRSLALHTPAAPVSGAGTGSIGTKAALVGS